MRKPCPLGLAVVASALFGALAHAQDTTTGLIEGRVLDAQGAAVPRASVTLRSGQGTRAGSDPGRGQLPY